MVDNAKFRMKMQAMRTEVKEALTKSVEANAEKVCTEMRATLAVLLPAVAANVEIDWTWGEAPRGAITLSKATSGKEFSSISVTIFARAKQGSGITPAWFEFGTSPRYHKSGKATGQITASPFFYPTYRANRQRVQSSLRGVLRRAVRKINAR